MPKELREQNTERSWWKAGSWRWPALAVIILLLLAGISYQAFSFSQLQPPAATPTINVSGAAVTATLRVLLATTPTAEPTETPIITIPPTVTYTPSAPTPGPSLDAPFGPGKKYLIHIAQPGDSWARLSDRFDTTPEVLALLNSGSGRNGIWVGSPVAVMPGQKDTNGVRPLLAVQITERTRVADIASQYGMQESDLRSENELGTDEWLDAGRWLIVYAKAS